jgi:hypothetical protein
MRIPIILAAATVLQPSPGLSEILNACPDAEVAGAQDRWGNDVVPDAMPLKAALAIARSINGTKALEIRLLHASGAREPSTPSISAAFKPLRSGRVPRTRSSSFDGSWRGRPRNAGTWYDLQLPSATPLVRCSSVQPKNEPLPPYRFAGLIVALPTRSSRTTLDQLPGLRIDCDRRLIGEASPFEDPGWLAGIACRGGVWLGEGTGSQ